MQFDAVLFWAPSCLHLPACYLHAAFVSMADPVPGDMPGLQIIAEQRTRREHKQTALGWPPEGVQLYTCSTLFYNKLHPAVGPGISRLHNIKLHISRAASAPCFVLVHQHLVGQCVRYRRANRLCTSVPVGWSTRCSVHACYPACTRGTWDRMVAGQRIREPAACNATHRHVRLAPERR